MGTRGSSTSLRGEQKALHHRGEKRIAIVPRLRLRPGLWNADGTLLIPAVPNLNAFMPMEQPIAHIVFSQVTKCTLIMS